jgi:dTDP-glucose pyrophosphorylase
MKAIILAAGKGSRMWPIGETTPKLLTPIFNKPLIDRFVEILADFVDEIIIVVDNGDFGNKIREYVSSQNFTTKVSFTIQEESKGTAHSYQMAKDFIPQGYIF